MILEHPRPSRTKVVEEEASHDDIGESFQFVCYTMQSRNAQDSSSRGDLGEATLKKGKGLRIGS